MKTHLKNDEFLRTNEYIESDSGRYRAVMQSNGDLAVYDTRLAHDLVWHANKSGGQGEYFAYMQGDGNFVVYPGTDFGHRGPALWSTGTVKGNGPYFIYMQDDGNLALYSGYTTSVGSYLWGIGSSVVLDFDLQKYAFKFPNSFTLTSSQLGLAGRIAGFVVRKKAKCGFCGGMCAGALNRFVRGVPVEGTSAVPAIGTPLYEELLERQKVSLRGDVIPTMLDRTMSPDKGHRTDPYHSMKVKTKNDWNKRLKPRLDAGKPTILVLISTEKDKNLDLTDNHQVLAIGYRHYRDLDRLRVKVYDPNDPTRLHTLSMVFSWGIIDAHDETSGKKFRGFFVNSQTDSASR